MKALRAALVLFVLGFASSSATLAVKPPVPSCWWEGTTLHAVNLPDEWSMTSSPYPTGMASTADSFTATFDAPFTVWVWTRGGPYEALFRPGRQLNDYKPVAVCVP